MASGSVKTLGALGAVALVLCAAQAALAETPVARFMAADMAAAKAAVLKSADLGPGWKGGLEKNTKVPGPDGCPGLWEPKQSDLIITGFAESRYNAGVVDVASTVQVYKTSQMWKLDWQRTVVDQGVIPCMRRQLAAEKQPGARFVSLTRTPFPRIGGQPAARLRIVFDYAPTGAEPVRLHMDGIAFGKGRTGLSLTFTYPYADRAAAHAFELSLSRLLASRLKA